MRFAEYTFLHALNASCRTAAYYWKCTKLPIQNHGSRKVQQSIGFGFFAFNQTDKCMRIGSNTWRRPRADWMMVILLKYWPPLFWEHQINLTLRLKLYRRLYTKAKNREAIHEGTVPRIRTKLDYCRPVAARPPKSKLRSSRIAQRNTLQSENAAPGNVCLDYETIITYLSFITQQLIREHE